MHVYCWLLICAVMLPSHCLRFNLTSEESRVTLSFQVKGKHSLYVVSSGNEQHNVFCVVEFQGQILFNETGNDLAYSHNYQEGTVNIMIGSSNDEERRVSFDFYSDEDPLVNIIDKRDIKILEGVLGGVYGSLQNISRNQQFHIERDESHKDTLELSESHIKWTGIVKIVFLLSSALVQLWIMKGFFKSNQPQPYIPL